MKSLFPNKFLPLVLITSIWVNASENFRYFVFVLPRMQETPSMDWFVFSIWGVWCMILTTVLVFITWLCANHYGKTTKTIFIAGTTCWATLFLLFWIAMINMNLAKVSVLVYTLPLSWLEMIVGAWITIKLLQRFNA